MSQTRLAALRLLGRRDYTVAEVRDRLKKKEHPADAIDEAITRLVEERLLDDRRVAAAHVRTSSALKGRGRLRIARELDARGIERSLAQEALAALPPDDEAASVRRFLDRKRLPARLNAAEHRRIFGQLLRRGFSPDVIARQLRARQVEPPDSDD